MAPRTEVEMRSQPTVHLLVRVIGGTPFYEAKWRYPKPWHEGSPKSPLDGRQAKRRIGPAWIEPGDAATGSRRRTRHPGWIKRKGRATEGYLTEDAALAAIPDVIAAWESEQTHEPIKPATFDDAAAAWLEHARGVRGIKASTATYYETMLRRPDELPKRAGLQPPAARIMRAFGGRPLADITAADVSRWLSKLDRDPALGPRAVNMHRQILHGIFRHATRVDTFGLTLNPVVSTDRRRERDPAPIVTYSPAEVHAVGRALREGRHRDPRRPAVTIEERDARHAEDEQDAAVVIVAGFVGLRLGELLALRWRDIGFEAQRVHVQRSYVGGVESSPKSRKGRTVPLADQPAQVLAQLGQRAMFTGPNHLVFCSRTGEHMDGSALRRRYKRARDVVIADAPDMPALRFHDLRHTFGTLAAGRFDLVNVQAMLGHADARTTSRYLHARPAAEDAAKLSDVFGADELPTHSQKEATP